MVKNVKCSANSFLSFLFLLVAGIRSVTLILVLIKRQPDLLHAEAKLIFAFAKQLYESNSTINSQLITKRTHSVLVFYKTL